MVFWSEMTPSTNLYKHSNVASARDSSSDRGGGWVGGEMRRLGQSAYYPGLLEL